MAETIVLDPGAVATGRTQLDITPWVDADPGVDWGDAAITAYMADQAVGSSTVDYRLPNRQIKIPLNLRGLGATTYAGIRLSLQQKVGIFQAEGGQIMRQVGSTPLYADVVNATLHLGGSILAAFRSIDVDAVLQLECVPDWYGAEVTLDSASATGVLTGKLKLSAADAVIAGNYPGRATIIVNDTSANDQAGLVWGFRARYYDGAAPLFYEAESLSGYGAAASATLTGSSGGHVMQLSSLPGRTWCPVLRLANATQQGTYRIWARVYSGVAAVAATPQVRLTWWVGTSSRARIATNDAVAVPRGSNFYLLDLGTIGVAPLDTGTYWWQGIIEAYAAATGDPISIDCIYLQPLDESAGRLAALPDGSRASGGLQGFDGFEQGTGVTLNGKTAQLGGTWTKRNTPDLTVQTTVLQRTATGDFPDAGALDTLGLGLGAFGLVAQCDVSTTTAVTRQGVIVRYDAPTSNFLLASVFDGTVLNVRKRIGGVLTNIANAALPPTLYPPGSWLTVRIAVDTAGRWWAWTGVQGSPSLPLLLSGQDNDFSGSGALASGDPGIYDEWQGGGAATRSYDNFSAWLLAGDAVVFASKHTEIRTDRVACETSTSTIYQPASSVIGDLPRIPPSRLENRPVELFVKPSRGDLDQVADNGLDAFTVQVKYRPSYLFVGE